MGSQNGGRYRQVAAIPRWSSVVDPIKLFSFFANKEFFHFFAAKLALARSFYYQFYYRYICDISIFHV